MVEIYCATQRNSEAKKIEEKLKRGYAKRIADGSVPAVEELNLCWGESSVFHQLQLHCGARYASTYE